MKLFQTHAFSRLVLNATQSKEEGYVGTSTSEFALIGKQGIAYTDMMPSGKVEIESNLYDASAIVGFVSKGSTVEVTNYEGAQIKVKPVVS